MKTHMDGARLLNAVVESGTSAADYAAPFDSLWIDLSKGLGCPIGGVLAGDGDFIEEAWRLKHMFGGAMRQSGIIAAAGVYALENNVERLSQDHANARTFATRIAQVPGIDIDVSEIETNLVYFGVSGTGKSGPELSAALKERGIHIGSTGQTTMRAVTHLDVDEKDVITAAQALAEVIG
jgi:threonine aldolase